MKYKAQTGFVPPEPLRLDTVQCIVAMPGLNKEMSERELQARKNDKGLKTLPICFYSFSKLEMNQAFTA